MGKRTLRLGMHTFDVRTISSYYTCRTCKQTLPPQMVIAWFETFRSATSGKIEWRVCGWECLNHQEVARYA